MTQKKHERRCIFFFFFRAGPNDAPFRDDLRLPRGIFSFISRLLSSSSLRSKTFSHPRRLVKCIIKIRTQKRHFYLPFVWRGKKINSETSPKTSFFWVPGFFLHEQMKLSFKFFCLRQMAKSIQQRLSPPQIFCQKKEASPLSFFIIVFARINTRTTYTLRSGKQPTLKKKSPREEDICVHK